MATPADSAAPDAGADPTPEPSDQDLIDGILAEDEPKEPEADEPEEPEADEPEDSAEPEEEPEEEGEEEGEEEESEGDGLEDSDGVLAEAREALAAGDLKKAMKLAFGKTPEAIIPNAAAWTHWRKAQTKAKAAHQQREAQHQQRQSEFRAETQRVIQELQPAAAIIQAQQAYQQSRDPDQLVAIIEQIAGVDYNTVQKSILHGQKLNPATARVQRELAEVKAQLAERQRLEQEQAQRAQLEQQRQANLEHIRSELTEHKASKVPKFAERVYRVLERTADPTTGRATMTVEDAGNRVYRAEAKRVKASPLYRQKPKAGAPAPAPVKKGKRPPLRRDSKNNGAKLGNESDDDIIADILRQQGAGR